MKIGIMQPYFMPYIGYWQLMNAACFRNKYKGDKLEKARDFSNRILVLPLYADLELKQVDRISEIVNKAVEGEKI